MSTDDTSTDPLLTAAKTAWLEYAKGTYSETDKKIFMQGFRDGWRARREHAMRQLPQSYTGTTVHCWVCRGSHQMGIKWCPVMMRIF